MVLTPKEIFVKSEAEALAGAAFRNRNADVHRYNRSVTTSHFRSRVTGRVFRNGEQPEGRTWQDPTPEERVNAVWELTRLCLVWRSSETGEPRLQRSVSRIQRPRG